MKMRFRLLKMFGGVFCLLAVSGCNVSAPQFESAVALAETVLTSQAISTNRGTATWLASVNGQGAVLTPYISNDLVVFANADGDAIAFDGWIIRSVVGFSLEHPLSISGKQGHRTFRLADQQTQTECDEWSLSGMIWSQICANGAGEIVLDGLGNIRVRWRSEMDRTL